MCRGGGIERRDWGRGGSGRRGVNLGRTAVENGWNERPFFPPNGFFSCWAKTSSDIFGRHCFHFDGFSIFQNIYCLYGSRKGKVHPSSPFARQPERKLQPT